jgi:hypothetical protein
MSTRFTLSLATEQPRQLALRLWYGAQAVVEVSIDDQPVTRLEASADQGWQVAQVPLPASAGTEIVVTLHNISTDRVALNTAALQPLGAELP